MLNTHARAYTYMHPNTHSRMYTNTCVYMNAYSQARIHSHSHFQINTHTYRYIFLLFFVTLQKDID